MKLTKHIKRKFQKVVQKESDLEILTSKLQTVDGKIDIGELLSQETLKKHYNKNNIVTVFDEHEPIISFVHNDHGRYLTIPFPDVTLIYFHYSYMLNAQRIAQKKELMPKLVPSVSLSEDVSSELYKFYGIAATQIITLFTSIESYINHSIPKDYKFVRVNSKMTETFDAQQCQRWLTFDDKLKKVLKDIRKKDFFTHETTHTRHIQTLKEVRDELVHAKSDPSLEGNAKVLQQLLKFNYDDTMAAVATMFNFYTPEYVELCPCSNDW